MPSRPQANPSHMTVAVNWLRRHPFTVLFLALVVTILLYHVGALHPADWWGDGMEVRR